MADDAALAERLRATIRDVPDFPRHGIIFKDITPVLSSPDLFGGVVDALHRRLEGAGAEAVAGVESRGFIFGAPLALRLGIPFVPIRKQGKLPYRTVRVDYALEYGVDSVEAHEDALEAGQRVLLVDDLLATGGTAAATVRVVERLGARVVAAAFVVELAFLDGRAHLGAIPVHTLVRFEAGS